MRARDDDEREPRVDRWRRLAAVGVVLLPAAVLLAVTALGPPGAEGRFRGALAGLVVVAAVGAFGTGAGSARALRAALTRAGLAALGAGLAYGAQGLFLGTGAGGLGVFVLCFGVGAAGCGLAALGRAMRTPALAAGAVAACVLWTAMAGLFWADPVARHLERTRRRSFRQAVLHVDPSLAMAYGAVGYDRLRSEEIYFDVPLASSLYERPGALTTGTAWLVIGLVAWNLALLVAGRRGPRVQPGGAAATADAIPGHLASEIPSDEVAAPAAGDATSSP